MLWYILFSLFLEFFLDTTTLIDKLMAETKETAVVADVFAGYGAKEPRLFFNRVVLDPSRLLITKCFQRWRMMASAQEIARRIRSNSSHSKDSVRGPVKATNPIHANSRTASEGVFRERPKTQCGQRPSSGGFLDDKADKERSQSGLRPSSSRSVDNADLAARRARMLQRQNATTEPDECPQYTPKPPPQSIRPKSAKGRPRSRSGARQSSQTGGSRIVVDALSSDSPPPQQVNQPRGSFSKYTPLPSIGSLPSVASLTEMEQHNSPLQRQEQRPEQEMTACHTLVQQVNDLLLSKHRTVPSEPSQDEPNRINLAIKLLDGSRHERWFHSSDTLDDVLAYAESVSGDNGLPIDCEICTNDLPRRIFKDMSLTLESAGLKSRTVLHIQES